MNQGGGPETGGFSAHDEWRESDHPRGQPENAGEFAAGGGGEGREEREFQEAAYFDRETKRENYPIEKGIKGNPKQCTQEALRGWTNGEELHLGEAVNKNSYERAFNWWKDRGVASSIERFPHAWNVKDGKIIDRALGSKNAEDYLYFGIKIPDEELKNIKDGDELARNHFKLLKAAAAAGEAHDEWTADRAPAAATEAQASGFFTVAPLGPSRALTPEGFLHCRDVPVARTGLQLYGPGETPVQLGISGRVQVERDPEEVFAPDTIASLQGKPVVNDHPLDEDGGRLYVTIENWPELAVGVVINPRRGQGDLEEFLVADLVIYRPEAIELINQGKRELSVGYEAEYVTLGPGRGKQVNILCNHVALVDRGRCGPSCAIGDAIFAAFAADVSRETCPCESGANEEDDMTVATTVATTVARPRVTLRDRIRAAFYSRDQAGLEEALTQGGEGGLDAEEPGNGNGGNGGEHHVHLHLGEPGNGGGNGGGAAEETPAGAAGEGNGGAAGANGGADPGELLRQAVTGIHQEMDEMWDAINSISGGGQMADAYPGRDARRGARDSGGGAADEFGEAPGTSGGRTILPGFEMEAPPGTQTGDVRRAHDSALFEDSFADTIATGEILVPGIRLPTFDRAARPKATFDALCAFRRKVMDLAFNQPETRDIIDEVTQGRFQGAARLDCGRLRDWFFAAGALKAQQNDHRAAGASRMADAFRGPSGEPGLITNTADWQAALNKYYAEKKPPIN